MGCREHSAGLSRLADGELSGSRAEAVRDHLRRCEGCRETLHLLEVERESIRGALSAAGNRPRRRRTFLRSTWVAAVLLVVLGVGLTRLHGAYRDLDARSRAAGEEEPDEALLSAPVLVSSDGLALDDFLERVSACAEVKVRLAESAILRLGVLPEVHVHLVRPIRLGSLLHLLEGFYGLDARVEEGSVLLE